MIDRYLFKLIREGQFNILILEEHGQHLFWRKMNIGRIWQVSHFKRKMAIIISSNFLTKLMMAYKVTIICSIPTVKIFGT